MIKQYADIFRRSMILFDACLIIAIFIFSYRERIQESIGLPPLDYCIWIGLAIVFFWMASLYYMGMYKSFRLKSLLSIINIIIRSAIVAFVVFGTVVYVFKIYRISRILVFMVFGFTTLVLIIEKMILFIFFKEIRRRGFNFRNVLVIGTNTRAQNFVQTLNQHRDLGLKVIGILDEDMEMVGKKIDEYDVIGTFKDLATVLENNVVDQVVIITTHSNLDKVEPLIHHCETTGTTISVAVDFFNPRMTIGRGESILGIPMVTFQTVPDKIGQLILKRLTDMFVSGILLLLTLPLNLILAILVKTTSKGPVFFVQQRVGLQGRIFNLYKFRTMCDDAEDKLADLKHMNEMQGPAFKIANDSRITPIGKFLRKWSLDELPQLWNIFHGEMSLVGPRPPMPREVEQYDYWQRRRLSMRPGLTGLWQVSGRNNIAKFDEWVKLDLRYIDSWSIKEDLKIILRTIPAVLKGSGAR